MSHRPFLWCPMCGARFDLPDQPPTEFRCSSCGPVKFADMRAPARAYLLAATATSGAPAAGQQLEPRGETGGLELRDDTGAPIYHLQRAAKDEAAGAKPAVEIDPRGVESLLAQIPQAALTGLMLNQASGHVVLSVAPQLAAQLSSGAARFMRATTVGFRGNVVDTVTGVVLGQASFTTRATAPADPRIKYRIGTALLESTPPQFDEAIAVLKQGLEIDPRDFDLNRALYIAYEAQGRQSEGLDHLVTASKSRPDDEFVRQRAPVPAVVAE